VLARRPREAILVAYVIVFVWLFVPEALIPIAHHMGPPLGWVGPVNDWMLLTNPLHVWRMLTQEQFMYMYLNTVNRAWVVAWMTTRSNLILVQFLWMAGLQAGFGVLFLVLAIVGLRPLRGSEGRRAVKEEERPFLATIARALRTDP